MIKRLVAALSMLAASSALALALPLSASASTVGGPYSVTPESGQAQAFHWFPTFDSGNWNYQAVAQCSDGTFVFGGWHAFSEQVLSNTPSCSSGGHGHMILGDARYRQSSPIEFGCWIPGFGRHGSCSN